MTHLPPFPGFRDEAFTFFRDLALHNDREWFKPRKAVYEDEIVWPFKCLIADAAARMARQGVPITGDPERALFRIYRDTRFSKNKAPYKTHAGAVLSRTGERDGTGVMYIHVEPAGSFLAGGFWQPENPFLGAWRARMVGEPDEFLDVVGAVEGAGLEVYSEDTLKRLPRGFEEYAGSPLEPYLKWKSYLVTRPVSDAELHRPEFTDTVVETTKAALPLLRYGWNLEQTPRLHTGSGFSTEP